MAHRSTWHIHFVYLNLIVAHFSGYILLAW